jgi:hypothetical protein
LTAIKTELLAVPHDENNNTAIVQATVTIGERVFMGIGDASLKNVAPAMQNCLIRMAETRAKARALRDAINGGLCSVEELSEHEEEVTAPRPTPTPRPPFKPTKAAALAPMRQAAVIQQRTDEMPLSEAQVLYVEKMAERLGIEVPVITTRAEAREWLRKNGVSQ